MPGLSPQPRGKNVCCYVPAGNNLASALCPIGTACLERLWYEYAKEAWSSVLLLLQNDDQNGVEEGGTKTRFKLEFLGRMVRASRIAYKLPIRLR